MSPQHAVMYGKRPTFIVRHAWGKSRSHFYLIMLFTYNKYFRPIQKSYVLSVLVPVLLIKYSCSIQPNLKKNIATNSGCNIVYHLGQIIDLPSNQRICDVIIARHVVNQFDGQL